MGQYRGFVRTSAQNPEQDEFGIFPMLLDSWEDGFLAKYLKKKVWKMSEALVHSITCWQLTIRPSPRHS